MDTDARGFPPEDMRVSDAERDRALSELSDSPADTAAPRRTDGYLVPRLTIGASLTAICFGGVAVNSAMHPGLDWTAALTPAAVAVLCVVLVIILRVRARRGPLLGSQNQPGG